MGRHCLRLHSDEDYLQRTRVALASKQSSSQAHSRCKPLEQDPEPRHSALQPAATKSFASQVGCIFEEKNCLSPLDVLPTSCRLPPSKGALPAYQDVLDALRKPLDHQGRRYSISRYLHVLEKIYLIFLHFSCTGFFSIYTGFFSIFRGEKSGLRDHIFLHFYGEKSGLKATFFSTFQVQFRGFPGGSTPSISDYHNF